MNNKYKVNFMVNVEIMGKADDTDYNGVRKLNLPQKVK